MHIALFSRAWPIGHIPSGIVTYVHCLREALLAQGHRVSVFAESIAPHHQDAGVYPVADSWRRRLSGYLLRFVGRPRDEIFSWGEAIAQAMAHVHRRDPIDVVEMEESFGWCAAVQADLDVPVVVKLHGPAFLTAMGHEAQSPLSLGRIRYEGEALSKVAAVISPSRFTLEATIARYGAPPGLTEHVPNPLPVNDTAPQWSAARCDPRTVLFVGRFDSVKGGDLVIQAFSKLLERYPDLRLLFVGPDVGLVDERGVERRLNEYAREVLGPTRLSALSVLGKLDAEPIGRLRAQAALTIVASRWENQCYTALEAMAQGCPVVGTDTGGISEIIEHCVTGLLSRSGDSDDIARAVGTILDAPALAARLGAQAREFVRRTHDPSELALKAATVYERSIAAYRGRARGR